MFGLFATPNTLQATAPTKFLQKQNTLQATVGLEQNKKPQTQIIQK